MKIENVTIKLPHMTIYGINPKVLPFYAFTRITNTTEEEKYLSVFDFLLNISKMYGSNRYKLFFMNNTFTCGIKVEYDGLEKGFRISRISKKGNRWNRKEIDFSNFFDLMFNYLSERESTTKLELFPTKYTQRTPRTQL